MTATIITNVMDATETLFALNERGEYEGFDFELLVDYTGLPEGDVEDALDEFADECKGRTYNKEARERYFEEIEEEEERERLEQEAYYAFVERYWNE